MRLAPVLLAVLAGALGPSATFAQAPEGAPQSKVEPHRYTPPPASRDESPARAAVPPEEAAKALRPLPLANPGFEPVQAGQPARLDGWTVVQHAGKRSYVATADSAVHHSGAYSLRLANTGPEPYGLVYQSVPAQELRGRTVRFSGWMRTEDTKGSRLGAGAGLTVQAMRAGTSIASTVMKNNAIAGTTDWTRYEVVLAVPAQADQVEVGVLLYGPGTLWLDDVALDEIAPR